MGIPFDHISETQATAEEAARKVKVNFSEIRAPVLTAEEGLAKGMEFKDVCKTVVVGTPNGKGGSEPFCFVFSFLNTCMSVDDL